MGTIAHITQRCPDLGNALNRYVVCQMYHLTYYILLSFPISYCGCVHKIGSNAASFHPLNSIPSAIVT